jgi:hypothetical protein
LPTPLFGGLNYISCYTNILYTFQRFISSKRFFIHVKKTPLGLRGGMNIKYQIDKLVNYK